MLEAPRQNVRQALALTALLLLAGCGGSDSPGGNSVVIPTPTPTTTTPLIQTLANQPPTIGQLAILLTDGSVLIQGDPGATTVVNGASGAALFYRLVPDANGDYEKGTWSQISAPPSGYAPYAGASAVFADGRVVFVGGEYNQNNYNLPFAPSGLTNMSAVYDPVANTWTMIPPPPGEPYIGDVPALITPNGHLVYGAKLSTRLWDLDPTTLAWSQLPSAGKADNFAEEGFTLMPSGAIFTVDLTNTPHAEHYAPSLGQWISDGVTPALLPSPTDYPSGLTFGPAPQQTVGGVTYGPGPTGVYYPPGEIGPAILRPDGTVFATGSAVTGQAGHTAIYTPGATVGASGSWTAGPDFPNADNAGDSSAALMPGGNVLVAGDSGALYEFDGAKLTQTVVAPPPVGGYTPSVFVLPLPSGQALVLVGGAAVELYTPKGTPSAAWAPTITGFPASVSRGSSYVISGTQFNGLSQAAAYGDELSSSTNFPLVRIKNTASGHVFYARTHDHSTMAVATGAATVSTRFDVPPTAETGAATLVVVANGIPSTAVNITVN